MATYSDNFNRADSTDLGPNWSENEDDWSINGNQLKPGTLNGGYVVYTSPLDTSDHYSEIVISTVSATSMGVIARSDASGLSFYLWRNSGTAWNLFSNVSGTFVQIAGGEYTAAAVDGDIARIECQGSTIKGFVNGIERASVTDTAITTGLYAGVRSGVSNIVRYDNFLAGDLETVPADTGAFLGFM